MGCRCWLFGFHTLVLVFLFSFFSIANAEYESVHRCDVVGAHFNDLEKWSIGVTDEELAPQLAIKFCYKILTQLNGSHFDFFKLRKNPTLLL